MKDLCELNQLLEDAREKEVDAALESNLVHEKCEYWGLTSHKSMVDQQKTLNTMLSDIIQGDDS